MKDAVSGGLADALDRGPMDGGMIAATVMEYARKDQVRYGARFGTL